MTKENTKCNMETASDWALCAQNSLFTFGYSPNLDALYQARENFIKAVFGENKSNSLSTVFRLTPGERT